MGHWISQLSHVPILVILTSDSRSLLKANAITISQYMLDVTQLSLVPLNSCSVVLCKRSAEPRR